MNEKLPRDLKRIAVFRALNLGDLLCVIPAIRALRASYPAADITLIGLPLMADFARRFEHYFNSFTSFPGITGLPEQIPDRRRLREFFIREREAEYDLVLQMHGSGRVTNRLVSQLDAKHVGGYFRPGEFCPDPSTFMPYPAGIAEPRRHIRLMNFLGMPSRGEYLEFPILDSEWAALETLARDKGIDLDNYVCVHPGARDIRRWWAPEKFAQVADVLAARGSTVVFTGTVGERSAVEKVRQRMTETSINLAGQTELGVLAALVGRARLLVSNDTGVSHLAAATATPSVVIFLASDPVRWAPLDKVRHQVVLPQHSRDVANVVRQVDLALELPSKDGRPRAGGILDA